MQTFLRQVAEYIQQHYKDKAESVCLVMPNKRAALFFKKHLYEVYGRAIWVPTIQSAEEFVEKLSGLNKASETDLLALLYISYKACNADKAEPFDKFARWGHLMLSDFNELDRYLAPAQHIYKNLKNIKEIENWSLAQEELTAAQQSYLSFMDSIGSIYEHYTSALIDKGWAYQGLIYKKAVENIKINTYTENYEQVVFCGFNALNEAEKRIANALIKKGKATFLWDADVYYLQNTHQEAGYFLRQHIETYKANSRIFLSDFFKQYKKIKSVSVSGQIGQCRVAVNELEELLDNGVEPSDIAIVLANEKLLWPLLKFLPSRIKEFNITMEYPVKLAQVYGFIEKILDIQYAFVNPVKSVAAVYYKDFIYILEHPLFNVLNRFYAANIDAQGIINQVVESNMVYLSHKTLAEYFINNPYFLDLFVPWKDCKEGNLLLSGVLKNCYEAYMHDQNYGFALLEAQSIQVILPEFSRMEEVIETYPFFNEVKSYRQLVYQTLSTCSVPFIGEPLSGLQIMGVLETRTLDFKHVIILGANEGILPSGKSQNSFLPNDLKRVFGLPLHFEKDAIYAYHFYRLLQRASSISIVYDNQTDDLGKGERSRFVTQLLFEYPSYNQSAEIEELNAVLTATAGVTQEVKIKKNEQSLLPIKQKIFFGGKENGLSASAFNVFKECSLRFYFRYGARISELKELEENAEAGTFGSILHEALENIYKPFIGKDLTEKDLRKSMESCESIVQDAFQKKFKGLLWKTGKNYLQIEVITIYVKKQLQRDIDEIAELNKQNKRLTVIALECSLQTDLPVFIDGEYQKASVVGKIDRIDKYGEFVRIIDYKNSVKQEDQFKFRGVSELFAEKGYSKQFQLWLYVWLLWKNKMFKPGEMMPVIIPFKQFESGLFPVTEDKRNGEPLIFTDELLISFEENLSLFAGKILNKEEDFVQTDELKNCEYCEYRTICNR